MTIKIGEALDLNMALISASNISGSFKFSFAIGKNILKLKPILKNFEDERQVIIDSAKIEKIDNGFDFDSKPEAKEKLMELLQQEIEVDLHTIKLDEEVQKLALSGAQIVGLDLILVEA